MKENAALQSRAIELTHPDLPGCLLFCRVMGEGPKALLAFHGYGLDGTSWQPLLPLWKEKYTLYAFDLFYHGISLWPDQLGVLKAWQWQTLMESLFQKESIQRFSLAGYSMGGRFALFTAQRYAHRLDELYLFAADGLRLNLWYKVATRTQLTLSIFKYFSHHPEHYVRLSSWANRWGLVSDSLHKFADLHMTKPKEAKRVYRVWKNFRAIEINRSQWFSLMNQYGVRVQAILGQYDRVIPKDAYEELHDKLDNYALRVVECGHNALLQHYAKTPKTPKHGLE